MSKSSRKRLADRRLGSKMTLYDQNKGNAKTGKGYTKPGSGK